MEAVAQLTTREQEIAELFAWGAAKKEVACRLFISERTVENHARSIYEKIGIGKVNELSAWWFCTRFGISFELSPLKKKIIAAAMSLCLIFSCLHFDASRRNGRSYRMIVARRHRIEFIEDVSAA